MLKLIAAEVGGSWGVIFRGAECVTSIGEYWIRVIIWIIVVAVVVSIMIRVVAIIVLVVEIPPSSVVTRHYKSSVFRVR